MKRLPGRKPGIVLSGDGYSLCGTMLQCSANICTHGKEQNMFIPPLHGGGKLIQKTKRKSARCWKIKKTMLLMNSTTIYSIIRRKIDQHNAEIRSYHLFILMDDRRLGGVGFWVAGRHMDWSWMGVWQNTCRWRSHYSKIKKTNTWMLQWWVPNVTNHNTARGWNNC